MNFIGWTNYQKILIKYFLEMEGIVQTTCSNVFSIPLFLDQVSPQQPVLPHISADDVLESLAINSNSEPPPEDHLLSDVNNNGSPTSQQLKESPTPRYNHQSSTSPRATASPQASKTAPPVIANRHSHPSPPASPAAGYPGTIQLQIKSNLYF